MDTDYTPEEIKHIIDTYIDEVNKLSILLSEFRIKLNNETIGKLLKRKLTQDDSSKDDTISAINGIKKFRKKFPDKPLAHRHYER